MNDSQKQAIQTFRCNGLSYAQIAKNTGLSANTVKSFCRRACVTRNNCKYCGRPLAGAAKPKTFCSDTCRQVWWRAHPGLMNRKTVRRFVCANCRKTFTGYGNRDRKYCSRNCYTTHRYGVP